MSYYDSLEHVLQQIEYVDNKINKDIIHQFSKYIVTKDASANYQSNCIKIMLMFVEFLENEKGINLTQINSSDHIVLNL
jgi:hypothetical protein